MGEYENIRTSAERFDAQNEAELFEIWIDMIFFLPLQSFGPRKTNAHRKRVMPKILN